MSSNNLCRATYLALLLLCAGCGLGSAFRAASFAAPEAVRLDVPFVQQTGRTDCGPAALASVLAFRGRHIPLDEVTRRVHTPAMQRTLLPDMENYARSLGFSTRSGSGDTAVLREAVNAGSPVIVLANMGGPFFSQGHYLVVYGHDERGFLLHAGTRGSLYVRDDELLQGWNRMNRLYLVVE
ncbi:cysteine peptidase family C39 domain-containing protein [Desulfomicrobium escambiense]|uniref:cysteine peptidase family C39 domain-containing protein n=1 Tax=Desulfomicrobium escambiense TaxID=29503 RepID=UPI000A021E52|nr:cysteine peptidase family C39 domain-containing protein [Desulfomicrobium escambiense]